MYNLQTSVEINGASFGIRDKGDFRMVLKCFKALNDPEIIGIEKLYTTLIIFYEDFEDLDDLLEHEDIIEDLLKQMFLFFDNGEDNLQSNTGSHRVLDWDKDSNLICSAVNNVAKQEIRSLKYLHWWTFLGYYMAIGECLLSHVISIRYKISTEQKLDKHEQKFRQENPQFFDIDMRSMEQKEADDYIKQLWGDA